MTENLQIEVRDTLASVPAIDWNRLNVADNPFLQHAFLYALESTGCLGRSTGWFARYFLLWSSCDDDAELIGAVPTYIKTNSYGEFVFDWAWAEAYQQHNIEYYPKLVSSIPFTPASGRRLLVRDDQADAKTVRILISAVLQYCKTEQFSSLHWLFITEAEGDFLASTGHLLRIDCQYHWQNRNYQCFEDFLLQCTAKRRKTIRRERRYVTDAGLRLERRMGTTLNAQEWRWVHQFYQTTFDRKWGNPSLTEDFFLKIGDSFGANVLIVFVYDNTDESPERPIACSIMFVGGDALYGRFWGCRATFNSLHFETCYYQGIEFCIENGIQRFEPGAQGEHKITRGFEPTITRSAHFIAHSGFRQAIEKSLQEESKYVQQRCAGLTNLLPFRSDINLL